MPVGACCSGGVALAALLTVLLVPAPYYAPVLRAPAAPAAPAPAPPAWPGQWARRAGRLAAAARLPALDVLCTAAVWLLALAAYTADYVHRKLTERRIAKLTACLVCSVSRVRAAASRHQRHGATLRAARAATAEYRLLLYLMLARRPLDAQQHDTHNCMYHKEIQQQMQY